jgi:dynein intermediate chain 1, axonemal
VSFSSTASQYEIFDAYVDDLERQRQAKEKKSAVKRDDKDSVLDKEDEVDAAAPVTKDSDIVHSSTMQKSLKIIERMVNQNTYDEISQDFKYWEDASDNFKEGEGVGEGEGVCDAMQGRCFLCGSSTRSGRRRSK